MDIQFDITFIVEFVFIAICLIAARYVYPWLKSNMSVKQQQEVNQILDVIVDAAEQLFGGSGRGAERKEYALKCVSAWLNSRGIKIDAERLDILLEAAVFRMKKSIAENASATTEQPTPEVIEEVEAPVEEIPEDEEFVDEFDEGDAEEYEEPTEDDEGNAEDRESCAE